MKIETIAVHSGRAVDPATGAVTPPIHMSTTFQREVDGTYPHGFVYGRSGNPTRSLLEECIRELEGGEAAASFSSGMAAIGAVFQSLSTGDHVITPLDLYHGTARLLRERLAKWGLHSSFVDMTDIDKVREAVTPATKIIVLETPSNPLLKITDISAIARVAHERGIVCVCDNTWATPVLQQCLELGADLVVHSTTKYLGGHGMLQEEWWSVPRMTPCFKIYALYRGMKAPSPLPSIAGCCSGNTDAALSNAGPFRKRRQSGLILGWAPSSPGGILSGASKSCRTPCCQAADEHVWRDALLPGPRRRKGSVPGGCPHFYFHPSHELG